LVALFSVPARAEDAKDALGRAAALLKAGRAVEAVIELDRIRTQSGLSAILQFQLGWLYGQARKYQTAIEIFRAVPEAIPDPLTRQYAIALCHFNLGEYQKTIDILSESKKRGLTDAKAVNLLGVAYAQLGEAERAYNSLREGIIEATDVDGYLNLVTLCVEYRNNELAEKIATQGIAAFPNDKHLFIYRGAVRMLSSELDAASSDFGSALKLAPKDPDAIFSAALTQYQRGSFEQASGILRDAIARGVRDSDLHYLLAESILRIDAGHADAAMKELNRAIEIDAASVSALVLRARLELRIGALQQAKADLERARIIDPESRPVLYMLARVHQQSGNSQEAVRLFQYVRQDAAKTVDEYGRKRLQKILVEKTPGQ